MHAIIQNRGIKQLIVSGVTTEVCVNTTVRETNDRGYDCLVLEDCVGSYLPDMHEAGLKMIKEQGGIFRMECRIPTAFWRRSRRSAGCAKLRSKTSGGCVLQPPP